MALNLQASDPLIGGAPGTSSGVTQFAVDVDGDGTFPCSGLILPGVDNSGCAQGFVGAPPLTLSTGDGVKKVGVVFGDGAREMPVPCPQGIFCVFLFGTPILGNASAVSTDTIILDTVKPIALAGQDKFAIERGGTVTFDAAGSIETNPALASGIEPALTTWDFKDGSAPATGQKVIHTFSSTGTFVGELRVKDRAGNVSDSRAFSVTVTPRPGETTSGGGTVGAVTGAPTGAAFRIDRVRVAARYRTSKLKGSLSLVGSSVASGALRAQLRKLNGGKQITLTTRVSGGAFNRSLPLPAGLLPGAYRLTITGPGGSVQSTLRLIPPREGVLRRGTLRVSSSGPTATFVLASRPVLALRGRLTVVWSQAGRRLGIVKVSSTTRITASLPPGATPGAGRLRADLRAGNTLVGSALR